MTNLQIHSAACAYRRNSGPCNCEVSKPPQRNGIYTLAESDLFAVFKHVGGTENVGYSRIVAQHLASVLVYGEDGKVRTAETLWLTPRLINGPVADLRHCLEIWLRETMRMSADTTQNRITWLTEALAKGRDL